MNIVLIRAGNAGQHRKYRDGPAWLPSTRLHLIEPLGFKLNEKHLRRAGLDYWDKLDVTVYSDFAGFPGEKSRMPRSIYMATTKAP